MEIRNGNPVFKTSEASTLSSILCCYFTVVDLDPMSNDAVILRGLWRIASDVSIGQISCLITSYEDGQKQFEEVLEGDSFPYSTPIPHLAEMLLDDCIEVEDANSQLSVVFTWASNNLITDSDFIQAEIADMQASDYEDIPEVMEVGCSNASRIEHRVGDLVLAGMLAAEWAQQLADK